jgi:3-oxoacyl-[acyl-carrier protein] reductase
MVKGIAVDLAPRGITVNNVQPGPTRTDMTAGHIDSIMSAIYMTGSSLTIDGGMAL